MSSARERRGLGRGLEVDERQLGALALVRVGLGRSRRGRRLRRGPAAAPVVVQAGVLQPVEGLHVELDGAEVRRVGAAVGTFLARVLRDPRRFVAVTTIATALSLVPAVAAPDDLATGVVLVAAHLVAAAIVIPALARRLAADR